MVKSFNKFKKPCFWPIFGPFSQILGQKKFARKSGSVTNNFIWVSSTMPKLKKTNDTIQKDGRNDRPYFIGPFQLPTGGPQKLFPLYMGRVQLSQNCRATANGQFILPIKFPRVTVTHLSDLRRLKCWANHKTFKWSWTLKLQITTTALLLK